MREITKSVLLREFQRFFPDLDLSQVTTFSFETDKERLHAWILETLIWTCARLDGGEYREALRGYGQAKEYRGRNGGFWPSGVCSDAAIDIQNHLEDLIAPRGEE